MNHERFDKPTEGSEVREATSPKERGVGRAFDDLAKLLDNRPITRQRMLRLLVGAMVGTALAPIPLAGCVRQQLPDNRNTPRQSPDPVPQWDRVFQEALGGSAMGYYYVAAQNGRVVSEGGQGYTRSPNERANSATEWTSASRINLASVSKAVTAVAYLAAYHQGGNDILPLDDAFYPYLKSKVPEVGSGLDTVTAHDLLTMKSALPRDGTLKGELWSFLSKYLQQGLVRGARPGVTYAYSNANFTILQGLMSLAVSSLPPPPHEEPYTDYVDYVQRVVLAPMGVNTKRFAAQPDPRPSATLLYADADDTRPGKYWLPISFVAPGGWVAPASELIKFLIGVRNNTVLPQSLTDRMFTEGLGWYTHKGLYGYYYHHNGGLFDGADPKRGVSTGIVHFTNGYDVVLLTNSPSKGIIKLMVKAFEAP